MGECRWQIDKSDVSKFYQHKVTLEIKFPFAEEFFLNEVWQCTHLWPALELQTMTVFMCELFLMTLFIVIVKATTTTL